MRASIFLFSIALLSCNGTTQTNKPPQDTPPAIQQAQTPVGTIFEELTFADALTKAGQEGKKVFVDCYTKTCGPCKMMVKNIFPQKECGEYFNPNYVCIMKDMEEGDGVEIAQKYNVQIYPTYLIINPDGTLFCEQKGAIQNATEFVAKIKELVAAAQ